MTIRSAALVINPSREEAISAAKGLAPLLYSAGFSLYTISDVSIEGIKKVSAADLRNYPQEKRSSTWNQFRARWLYG